MAAKEVYSQTTIPNPKTSCFTVPSELLQTTRFIFKIGEVLLSFVAFVLEEVIKSCISCGPLYFFEFVSCTAFLFTLLLLILLSTTLHTKVGISCWASLDFVYTSGVFVLFLISSIVFASNSGTTVERAAVAFGFLATGMFLADAIFFIKTNGFPLKKDRKTESNNGSAAPAPEEEKLSAE
ncbi:CKLF-like MARVEL transmembrane domain-containing protein 6 [Betta splendens]|uniref:CKLF-like MARVEL transmembrane domain-containing protein 6 n=1 Tax=Betta splendens TaxID=158456 RepID=A0A6P7KRP1_BETSP|nr:CKLF-like MARVEL transmembrane domain-containing protein 6 [Betta splendens]